MTTEGQRATRDLNQILDEAIELIRAGQSAEESLAHFPDHASELDPYLAIAEELHQQSLEPLSLEMDSWLATGRREIEAIAVQTLPKNRAGVMQRWVLPFMPRLSVPQFAVVCAVLVFFLSSLLVVDRAAAASGPGNALYGWKIASENVEITLTLDPVARQTLHLSRIQKRSAELQNLLQSEQVDPVKVAEVTSLLNEQVNQALDDAGQSHLDTQAKPQIERELNAVTTEVKKIEPKTPEQKAVVDTAAAQLDTIADTVAVWTPPTPTAAAETPATASPSPSVPANGASSAGGSNPSSPSVTITDQPTNTQANDATNGTSNGLPSATSSATNTPSETSIPFWPSGITSAPTNGLPPGATTPQATTQAATATLQPGNAIPQTGTSTPSETASSATSSSVSSTATATDDVTGTPDDATSTVGAQPALTPTRTETGDTASPPTSTRTPSIVGTPTSTRSVTPSVEPSDTVTRTPSATRTPSDTATRTPSVEPSDTATRTPSTTATRTPSVEPSDTVTRTPSDTATRTPSVEPSDTATRTPSVEPSDTATSTPSTAPTRTPTDTDTATPTVVSTPTSREATETLTTTVEPSDSPTSTPLPVQLTAVCQGYWRVDNPTSLSISFMWDMEDSDENGSGSVEPRNRAFFTTSIGKKVRLHLRGLPPITGEPSGKLCSTATPTITLTNTQDQVANTSEPTDQPTHTPADTPTPTASPSPTATQPEPTNATVTHTLTPTPQATRTPTDTDTPSPSLTPTATRLQPTSDEQPTVTQATHTPTDTDTPTPSRTPNEF